MSAPSTEAPLLRTPDATLPRLRLLPVPPSAPPYDDELTPETGLPTGLPSGLAAPIGPLRQLSPYAAPLRLVPDLPLAVADDDEEPGPRRTVTEALPPARPVARALVQGLLEVLAGVRPVSQLQRGTTPELYAQLELAVHSRPRTTGARPGTGAVRSLHVQEREDGVAEVCATVHRGQRMAAIALRLEGLGGRWTCTELSCI
jgi:hypothetical protein